MAGSTPREWRSPAQRRRLRWIGLIMLALLVLAGALAWWMGGRADDELYVAWHRANVELAQGLTGDCAALTVADAQFSAVLSELRLYGNPAPRSSVVYRAALAKRLVGLCGRDLAAQAQQAALRCKQQPDDMTAWLALAELRLAASDMAGAERAALQALRLGPQEPAAQELIKLITELRAAR